MQGGISEDFCNVSNGKVSEFFSSVFDCDFSGDHFQRNVTTQGVSSSMIQTSYVDLVTSVV